MAKYELRMKAREMRSKGMSVRAISKELGMAKSTTSIWVRDIILSVEQLQKIRKSWIKGTELGRLKGALMQKNRRLAIVEKMKEEGIERLPNLTDDQLFVIGVSLYWAEGSKKTGKLQVCNSDPKMIVFMINWLNKYFNLDTSRLSARVAINEIHKKREGVVKKYWSDITGIPISQFRKTSFKKAKPHKIYANYDSHFGTLDIVVLKPGELYYKMLGLVEGLASVAQW